MATLEKGSRSLITTQIDFAREGVQHGTLQVPHSWNRSAYGHIPIPITVMRQGQGPRVLLTGGNHGDEYEGPVALIKLVNRLAEERINGTLIIIPALNLPAVLNASRTSPIDNGNLNRSFPGQWDGSITEMIADYVETVLFPLVDGAIDLHAGGASFDHIPTLLASLPDDPHQHEDYLALVGAFGAPRAMILDMLGENRTYNSAATRNGVWFLGGEFGGGSRCDPDCLKIVEDGLSRVLHHLGITPELDPPPSAGMTQMLKVDGRQHYLFAPRSGIFEPKYKLGDGIVKGQLAGNLHDLHEPWTSPRPIYFEGDGIVVCLRTFAGVEPGDCLAMLARED